MLGQVKQVKELLAGGGSQADAAKQLIEGMMDNPAFAGAFHCLSIDAFHCLSPPFTAIS